MNAESKFSGVAESIYMRVELIARVGALMAGLLFVLGLLIVNIRLGTFGIYSSGFFKTEYVLVGAMYCLLLSVCYFSFAYGWKVTLGSPAWKKKSRARQIGLLVIVIASALLIFAAILDRFSDHLLALDNWKTWVSIFLLYANVYLTIPVGDILSLLWASTTSVSPEIASGRKEKVFVIHSGVLQLATLFGCLVSYANLTYPYLPVALGGGYRDPVIIVPTKDGIDVMKSLGLPVLSENKVGPVKLLTESDGEIFLIGDLDPKDSESAVCISRSLVQGMMTIPHRVMR